MEWLFFRTSLTHRNVFAFCTKPSAFHTRPSLIYFILLSNIHERMDPPCSARALSVCWGGLFDDSMRCHWLIRLDQHCLTLCALAKKPSNLISLRSPRSVRGFQVSRGWFCLYNQFRALCSESGTGKTKSSWGYFQFGGLLQETVDNISLTWHAPSVFLTHVQFSHL